MASEAAAIFHPFGPHMESYNPYPSYPQHNFYDINSNLADPTSAGYWDNNNHSVQPTTTVPNSDMSSPETSCSRRKRRRVKSMKNKEEMENQRMTHIAVERNRRRQMNDYLAVLRSLMPASYAQRGDQASIVGGAINFVKELEQLLQSLEANKVSQHGSHSNLFSEFFTFPQYSTSATTSSTSTMDTSAERPSEITDIEVALVESHANIKILTTRHPKQLLKIVAGFQSIGLTILHLTITTVDLSILYTLNVKVEDECQQSTVNEIATAVHDILRMIQGESSCQM